MRSLGIRGVSKVRTTCSDPTAKRAPDLVKRNFTADRPNRLWVTDITYVATWAGTAYACFIIDAFSRMIVGWRVAGHMRTDMVLDAVEMARWHRGARLEGLVTHSDAGSQFTSIRYSERVAELGAVPSIGTVGDSYDCDDGGSEISPVVGGSPPIVRAVPPIVGGSPDPPTESSEAVKDHLTTVGGEPPPRELWKNHSSKPLI